MDRSKCFKLLKTNDSGGKRKIERREHPVKVAKVQILKKSRAIRKEEKVNVKKDYEKGPEGNRHRGKRHGWIRSMKT